MKVILMRSPSNRRYKIISCSQAGKASSGRTEQHSVECWLRGSYGNPQTPQAVANRKLITEPIAKDSTHTTEHGEVKLVPTWTLYPYVLVSLVQEGTLQATERNVDMDTCLVTKSLTYTWSCLKNVLG